MAARVGALAEGGEILATTETLAEAGDVATANARTATVKGVTAPVSFAQVDWSGADQDPHCAVQPPSTVRTLPVTIPAAGDAR